MTRSATTLARRAALGYYRANLTAWTAVRRSVDVRVVLGVAQLAAVLALIAADHSGAAVIVAACGLLLLAVR